MIAPSTALILSVILRPFVSLTKRSLHVTGYLPAVIFSGIVYSTDTITSLFFAVVPSPLVRPNANSFLFEASDDDAL